MEQFCWNKARVNPDVKELLEEAEALQREFGTAEEKVLPYHQYKQYFLTGERAGYESGFFNRRLRLALRVIFYFIDEKEEDLKAIQDIIWAICGEYAWSVPAHISREKDSGGRVTFVDLFASETAFTLAEISAVLGDKLDEQIKERIRYEVERRVVVPFQQRTFWWEKAKHNWASVCAGYVGGTFLYLFPELFEGVRGRIESAMESFLSGFSDDGACLEGVSYWNYGFGMFCFYYELLGEREPDALKIFQREKVRQIALFYQRACLDGAIAVTFADCQPEARYSLRLMCFLKRIYGDAVKIPPLRYRIPMRKQKLPDMLRSFTAYRPEFLSEDIQEFAHFFPQSGMYTCKTKHYCFAAKGGHNDEPHNHNDVGSFLFVKGGRQVLCDIGVGFYTKDYFDPATRYQLLGNGSQGHSVPILSGHFQRPGREYAARDVEFCDGHLSMDILGAYGMEGSLIRHFYLEEEGVRLKDEFHLSQKQTSIVERFISYEEPKLEEGALVWENAALRFDKDAVDFSVSKESYYNNFKGTFDVWLLDFTLKDRDKIQSVEFFMQ